MRECNNSKIHISSNFLLSKSLTIMSDTLLFVPSLQCNTSLHLSTLRYTYRHFTTLIDTSLHLQTLHILSFTLHYLLIWLNPFTFPIVLFPLTSQNQTQYGYYIPKLTRVGTLIVATIYLQLLQNRYMFRSFTVLQCSYQHCVQPVASDVEVVGYLQQRLLC